MFPNGELIVVLKKEKKRVIIFLQEIHLKFNNVIIVWVHT